MKISAIIFDVDGVLLDSNQMMIDLHKIIAKKMNLRVPDKKEITSLWGKSFPELITSIWHDVDPKVFKKNVVDYIKKEKIIFPVVKGSKETLKKLKRMGFKLGIVTGRPMDFTIDHMKNSGFDLELFDVIVTGDDTKNHKPSPDPILRAVNLLKVKPEEIIYVGDSLIDFKAAKNAKVEFVGVLTGDVKEEEWKKNGVKNIIQSVADLEKNSRTKIYLILDGLIQQFLYIKQKNSSSPLYQV